MKIVIADKMPKQSAEIRRKVFVEEQGFQSEFDGADEIATHFLAMEGETAVATCRVYFNEEKSAFVIGRFAVQKEFRGKNVGTFIVDSVADFIKKKGAKTLLVKAQVRAVPFYKKVGFVPFGEVEEDEGIPHIWMQKDL